MRDLAEVIQAVRSGRVRAAHLAARAGVPRNVIHYLVTGKRKTVTFERANKLFAALDALTPPAPAKGNRTSRRDQPHPTTGRKDSAATATQRRTRRGTAGVGSGGTPDTP